MRHVCCEQAAFFKFFGLHLDLDFTFANVFGLCLDLDWVLTNQDWIWIEKYDSPPISAAQGGSLVWWREGIYGQTSVKHTKKEDFIHVLPRHLSQKKICVRSRELEVLAASLPHKFFKPHSFPMTRTCESIESSRKLRIYVVALIVSSSKRASKNLINRFHVPWGNLRQSLVYQGRRAPRVQQRGVTNVMGWWLTITFQSVFSGS